MPEQPRSTKQPRSTRDVRARAYALRLVVLPALLLACLTFSSPALAAECPNEQLRQESNVNPATGRPYSTALPDCRAYEQVTPVYKDGGKGRVNGFAEDGNALLYGGYGGFAGEPSGIPPAIYGANQYEAQRTASGWVSVANNPSSAAYYHTGYLHDFSFSSNFLREIWNMAPTAEVEPPTPAGSAGYYIREPDGAFVATAPTPTLVAGAYLGSSSNLSTVVLKRATPGTLPLLSADTTVGADSLYQIVGAGTATSTLELVGLQDGKLVSDCGTLLGAPETVTQPFHTAFNAISADGNAVVFTALADAVGGCLAGVSAPAVDEVYVQLEGARAVDVSEPTASDCASCDTSSGLANAQFEGASTEGSKVFFTTEQALLSGQTTKNIYEYDFNGPGASPEHPTGKITLVSAGSPRPEVQGVVRVSDDGSHVYFVARGVLTTTPNSGGRQALAGADNFYVYDTETGETKFIGLLCSGSHMSGAVTLPSGSYQEAYCPGAASAADSSLWGAGGGREAQSTSGGFLVFTSYAALTPDKTSSARAAYEYDVATGSLVRISIGAEGYDHNGNNDSYNASISPLEDDLGKVTSEERNSSARTLSNDGSYVFFTSGEALLPGAVAGELHIYEYHEGQVSLIAEGLAEDSRLPTLSLQGTTPTGSDVFFTTNESLVSQDTETGNDIYDARIDGGFPAAVPPPPGCSGEACQGPPATAPLLQSPGSALFTGGSNITPPPITPPPVKAPEVKPPKKTAPQIRAEKLAKAVKACKKKAKKERAGCETQARKKYGAKAKAKKTDRRVK